VGGIATFCRALLDSTLVDLFELRFVQTSSRKRALSSSGKATGANILEALKDCARFARACAAHRPAIAHICTAVGISFLKNSFCVLFARGLRCRVVLHPHCSFDRLYAGSRLWKWYCRRVFRLSGCVVVLSREWSALRDLLPGVEIHHLPNAIDTRPYHRIASRRSSKSARDVRVLYLGHLGEVKGTDDLLEAFKILDPGENAIELDLVGDVLRPGDEERVAAAAAASFGSGKSVRLIPPVSGEAKMACFERADIFVFPSHYEGMPMAILEALAAGLPIVATAVGGIPELVGDGENGILVPPREPKALAAAIERLCSDVELRARMGHRSLALSREYDIDRYAHRLAAIYEGIIGKGQTAG